MTLPAGGSATLGRPLIRLADVWAIAILRTVEAGWAEAVGHPDVNAGTKEIAITTRLRDGMISAVESGQFSWKGEMVVLPGTESRSDTDISQPDGRTDMSIIISEMARLYGRRGHDPQAVIECKRISGNSASLCREYAVNGVDRFRRGKYAGDHVIGFMIGYLISGDARSAASSINKYLSRKSRDEESLRPSNLVRESWAWQSDHQRKGNESIKLQHALLAFPSPKTRSDAPLFAATNGHGAESPQSSSVA